MAKFNTKKFNKQIVKILGGREMRHKAVAMAERRVRRARKETLHAFESHPVTREIERGAAANNLSQTLGGEGNLFSFIGFPNLSRPIDELRNYLNTSIELNKNPTYIKGRRGGEYRFRLRTPRISRIESITPSPWEGKSWTRGIERGITGLGYYMFSLSGGFNNSRSGTGLQGENKVRALAFRPIKYMTSILQILEKELAK